MEQLAITPKLLCCIADGGLPVTRSFLDTLATCDLGGEMPGSLAHRPSPPAGHDAKHTAALEECMESPHKSQDLLRHVWVVFTQKISQQALSKPLLHVGCQVQLLCTTDTEAATIRQELQGKLKAHSAPAEVWVVPSIDVSFANDLTVGLRSVSSRLSVVPLEAVVRVILTGRVDNVRSEAKPLIDGSTGGELEETERRGQAKADSQLATGRVPWRLRPPEITKEESFPQTQLQGPCAAQPVPHDVPASIKSVEKAHTSCGGSQGLRRANERECPLKRERTNDEQEPDCKPKLEVQDGAVAMSISSDTAAKADVTGLPPSLLSSGVIPQPPSLTFDTPKCQPKPERNADLDSSQVKIEKIEKVEPEPAQPDMQSSSLLHPQVPKPEAPPTVHPVKVWLPRVKRCVSKLEFVSVDGIDVPRASWHPGAATVVRAESDAVLKRQREEMTERAPGTRNFKLFRKATGQLPPAGRPIVTVERHVPSTSRLDDAFSAQPDLRSELPPLMRSDAL